MATPLQEEEICEHIQDLADFPLMEDEPNSMSLVHFTRDDKDECSHRFVRTFADPNMRNDYEELWKAFPWEGN